MVLARQLVLINLKKQPEGLKQRNAIGILSQGKWLQAELLDIQPIRSLCLYVCACVHVWA